MATTSSSSVPAQDAGKTHPFTCNSCLVAYHTSDLQRTHMQTDFHRYNLKRRVASLPPLTLEVFTEKVLANRADAAATAAKASFEKLCSVCQKTYYSHNAYTQHLNSSKHRSNVAARSRQAARNGVEIDETASVLSTAISMGTMTTKDGVDEDAEQEFKDVVENMKDTSLDEKEPTSRRPSRPHASGQDERAEHPLSPVTTASSTGGSVPVNNEKPPLNNCLFCNYTSPTFPLNITHMSRHHGMFIPEQDYLVDSEGLITHLYNKINGEHSCLYCPKTLHTASGIQTHMRDLGHCMINFDDEVEAIEIGEFYDFSSTWSDYDDDDSDSSTSTASGGVKVSSKRRNKDGPVKSGDEEDEGWETDSTISDVPSDEIRSIPISDRSHRYAQLSKNRHHSHSDPRKHRTADGFHSHAHATPHAVYHDDYELHLPTGRTAGHRSLNRYYKQNLRTYPSAAERMAQRAITGGSDDSDDSDVEMADGDEPQARGRGRDQNRQLVSRANGGLGMIGVSDARKKEVKAVEKRDRKREQRVINRFRAGNEKQGNFQKHYRDPLLQ